MQYMLDTANLEQITACLDLYPIVGITTNPTILKAEGGTPLKRRLLDLRALCGAERSLHVQLLSGNCDGMLREAEAVLALLGENTYVKIPVTEQGLKAIRLLRAQGARVTATAIYTLSQGLLAAEAGADYLAPYCNRMENNGVDFRQVIENLRRIIDRDRYPTKIVAASFKNATQITDAFACGAHAVTVAPDLLRAPLRSPLVTDAIAAFEQDFMQCYHTASLADALR